MYAFLNRTRCCCIAAAVTFVVFSHRSTCADTPALLHALEQRIEQFPAFRIAWKVVQVEPGKQPLGYTTYEMLVDADRCRVVRRVEGMADPLKGITTSFTNTFTDDGSVQYNFVSDFSELGRTPTGNRSFTPVNGRPNVSVANVIPIVLYFRPNAIRLHQFDINESRITTVDNDQTRIFSEGGRHDTLWQSAPPFALMHWEFAPPKTEQKMDQWTTTVEYGSAAELFGDASDAVIPVAFKVTRSSPKGDIRSISEAKVTAYTSRPEVSSNSFVIDYPEGTPVINGDNPDQKFVVRADGTFRPVSANDSHRYGSWLNISRAPVDSEVAHLDEARSWSTYLVVAAAVALIAFAAYRFRRTGSRSGGLS